jgi:hypothetical protein
VIQTQQIEQEFCPVRMAGERKSVKAERVRHGQRMNPLPIQQNPYP